MQFYSWKDIERFCLMNRQHWEDSFNQIEVYPHEITVYKKESINRPAGEILLDLFGDRFDPNSCEVKLDIGDISIPVYEDNFQFDQVKTILPLFRNILY